MKLELIGALIQKIADFQTVTGFEANVIIIQPELASETQLISKHLGVRIIVDDAAKIPYQVGFLA